MTMIDRKEESTLVVPAGTAASSVAASCVAVSVVVAETEMTGAVERPR